MDKNNLQHDDGERAESMGQSVHLLSQRGQHKWDSISYQISTGSKVMSSCVFS